ncbi:MAG: MBL fold metallo-hydrolase [Treponema sp.]|nr:MBL fold metallo-hydrolase [Treponema sp.]
MSLVQITSDISYLPASEKPLSCDVVFIKTDKETWIFDVGMNKQSVEAINQIDGPKNIVISHFHPDHILNLGKVSYENLYVSANTKKYVFKGSVVTKDLDFDCSPKISIKLLPSSHAKGCLCLLCGDYAFLGDGAYSKPIRGHHTYNAQLLQEMIKVMESMDVKYFCLSHDKNFIQSKESVLELYKNIYKRRTPDSSVIDVEDFFNSDGSVKDK